VSPGGVQHDEERNALVRRLARLHGKTPQEGLRIQGRRHHASGRATGKKRRGLFPIADELARWAERQPQTNTHARSITNELIRAFGKKPREAIQPQDIAETLARWQTIAHNSRRTKLTTLARLTGELNLNLGPIPKPPPPKLRETTATPNELQALLTRSPQWLRWLTLLCHQLALRSGEALKVRNADVDTERHELTVRAKGNKLRVLPTTPEIEAMAKMAAGRKGTADTAILWKLSGGANADHHNHSPQTLKAEWWRWKKKLGVRADLRIHDLRRTRATEIYRATRDVRLAQQFLGHDNLASTAYYLAPWDTQQLGKLIRELTPPKGWQQ
jgi:integrase